MTHKCPTWSNVNYCCPVICNILRHNVMVWRQWPWSMLVTVMAWCLRAPNHYLNQWWIIINETHFNGIWFWIQTSFHENGSKNIIRKMLPILFRSRCIKMWCDLVAEVHHIYEMTLKTVPPWKQGSWGQHGAHLGPTGPRWAPCWPHEPCNLGIDSITTNIICKKYNYESHMWKVQK